MLINLRGNQRDIKAVTGCSIPRPRSDAVVFRADLEEGLEQLDVALDVS
jgi:hypothetical protein